MQLLEEDMKQNTQKNRIIIILLVCAIACTILAGFMVWNYMTPSRSTIYVFNGDYASGTAVTADILTPIQMDSTVIANGASDSVENHMVTGSEYSEIIHAGEYLRMDVTEGMPLTSGMLSVQGGSTLEANMTSDSIAVSFSVDQFSGVTNELKTGSRVNIYSVINSEVRLIQQNKRILEVFENDGSIQGVSVEESVYESMELIYAIKCGSIYLGLVDASGYQSTEGSDPVYSSETITAGYESSEEEDEDIEDIAAGLGLDTATTNVIEEETTEDEEDSDSGDSVFTP